MKILITGGAGFIGTHLTRRLLSLGHNVIILDNFLPQVHGRCAQLEADIRDKVQLFVGDISDRSAIEAAIESADAIVHLAAETGTGQSMYEVGRYSRTNLHGTSELFEQIVKRPEQIQRVICASSRSIYGEGAYHCCEHGTVFPRSRSTADKKALQFDPLCPACGSRCVARSTPECAPPSPASFYGLTKLAQEQMTILFGNAMNIPSIALRFQNVYGPGQSLANPYTGILAIFSNLARCGMPIRVFEDGLESRDFVYVDDVVTAIVQALFASVSGCHILNVGSGEPTTVLAVAEQINAYFGGRSEIQITGEFREGDIRHGFADLTTVKKILSFEPRWTFGLGLERFLRWAEQFTPTTSGYELSIEEMRSKGLLHA